MYSYSKGDLRIHAYKLLFNFTRKKKKKRKNPGRNVCMLRCRTKFGAQSCPMRKMYMYVMAEKVNKRPKATRIKCGHVEMRWGPMAYTAEPRKEE